MVTLRIPASGCGAQDRARAGGADPARPKARSCGARYRAEIRSSEDEGGRVSSTPPTPQHCSGGARPEGTLVRGGRRSPHGHPFLLPAVLARATASPKSSGRFRGEKAARRGVASPSEAPWQARISRFALLRNKAIPRARPWTPAAQRPGYVRRRPREERPILAHRPHDAGFGPLGGIVLRTRQKRVGAVGWRAPRLGSAEGQRGLGVLKLRKAVPFATVGSSVVRWVSPNPRPRVSAGARSHGHNNLCGALRRAETVEETAEIPRGFTPYLAYFGFGPHRNS